VQLAVAEGGGACGLDNLRTLCTPCHRAQTAALRKRLRHSRAAATAPSSSTSSSPSSRGRGGRGTGVGAAGSTDIRALFTTQAQACPPRASAGHAEGASWRGRCGGGKRNAGLAFEFSDD